MNQNNIAIAEAYYTAMGEKNVAAMEKYLHPNVRAIGPLGEMIGKEAVLEAVKKLIIPLKTLKIRAKFGSGDQVMLALDLDFIEPIGNLPSAVLLNLQHGFITNTELFFDARRFEKKS